MNDTIDQKSNINCSFLKKCYRYMLSKDVCNFTSCRDDKNIFQLKKRPCYVG